MKGVQNTGGTLVEVANPGQGHRHLGNEQAIFAKHYEDKTVTQSMPTMPVVLRMKGQAG